MPVYEYAGLDSSGKTLKGILDADSTVAARQKLRASGIFPVEVKETLFRPKGGPSDTLSLFAFFQRVKPGEVYAITRQLSTLLGAGVPLVASLDSLISQKSSPLLKKIIAQIKESVNQGNSLAFSLSQHPKIFSNFYINMVRSGEASGSLDVVLAHLAEFGENQQPLFPYNFYCA
ncbi:MAG: type II secretion system F family protein [Deltaproteobacteria bacterium]|nr:type II secretion system F family protein [Deltaproteobacteria bacterium]